MAENLLFLAGKTAYKKISTNGLKPDDVTVAAGASGAAKWLILYELDKAIYSNWLKNRKKPLYLFGTSIGAWKFAAAAQNNPAEAFDLLAEGYIHQYYDKKPTPDKVGAEADRVLNMYLSDKKIAEILSHPFMRFSLSTSRSRKYLASEKPIPLALGLLAAAAANTTKRSRLGRYFERALFYDPRDIPPFFHLDDFPLSQTPLDIDNFRQALLASGSIPFAMNGVSGIPGAKEGIYRDGGIIDYHPAIPFCNGDDGIVLYPHFYPKIIPGWFDKPLFWRKPSPEAMDNVLLLAPSPEFVSKLPYGRIPDRKDFNRFMGKDSERVDFWIEAAKEGKKLADEFIEAVDSGRIREIVKPIDSYEN